jgi:hypothetical protein
MGALELCGLDWTISEKLAFQPRVSDYDRDMLEPMTTDHIKMPKEAIPRFLPGLYKDMRAERDAENFCQRLVTQARDEGVKFSPEFNACEVRWRKDEYDHYRGLRKIYSLLTGRAIEEIDAKLATTTGDFSRQEWLYGDELRICVALSFDEDLTGWLYKKDRGIYASMGEPFRKWFGKVIRDESPNHRDNFFDVVAHCHRDELGQVPEIMQRLVDMEMDRLRRREAGEDIYEGTFQFDRGESIITADEINTRSKLLLRRFRKAEQTALSSAA